MKRALLAVVLISIVSSPLYADTIILKNGGEIEGVITENNEHMVKIEQTFGSGVAITEYSRDEIDRVVTTEKTTDTKDVSSDTKGSSSGEMTQRRLMIARAYHRALWKDISVPEEVVHSRIAKQFRISEEELFDIYVEFAEKKPEEIRRME